MANVMDRSFTRIIQEFEVRSEDKFGSNQISDIRNRSGRFFQIPRTIISTWTAEQFEYRL